MIRIDKYLWAVRQYKTRTMAGDACRGGKIKVNGLSVKASRELKVGDIIEVSTPGLVKKIKVLELLNNRVGAPKVVEYMEDLTPSEAVEQAQLIRKTNYEKRDRGLGRPTKRDRRDIEALKKYLFS
ncbi:MAG: RNA-binding S4 domain-containing protein [Bacteroidales bacterium]|jgi:ribosome-associated heat shock protein Hsp15|nr:RNA-binding S4 domain-containing protein [Bacteroidales bacterium]